MAKLTTVTVTVAASTPMQHLGAMPSGWSAYARTGTHHRLLAAGVELHGGTPARMYLTALAAAMNKLKWACDITVACNDINIVRGLTVHFDTFRAHSFRAKQRNKDLWILVTNAEKLHAHNVIGAHIPAPDNTDLLEAQKRARHAWRQTHATADT